ncbi:MAG: enolase C-terminal domain-like protein [Gammaproteobacteria bacterium]
MFSNIKAVDLWHYSSPLIQPLMLRQRQHSHPLSERTGFLLHWQCNTTSGIKSYWTEIAPLPLFSREPKDQAKQQILEWFHFSCSDSSTERLDLLKNLYPSVSWGIGAGLSMARTDWAEVSILSNRWMSWDRLLKGLQEKEQSDIDARFGGRIKTKPPETSESELVQECNQIFSKLSPRLQLRLDLNQRWGYQQALKFAHLVRDYSWYSRIDYLEEPLAQPELMLEWSQETGMHCALDESLNQGLVNWPPHASQSKIKTWILKPMLLGYHRTLELIELAGKLNNIQIQLSNTLESHVSQSMWQWLISSQGLSKGVHGLDHSDWLPPEEKMQFTRVRSLK